MIFGHERARQALEGLPFPVMLLLGPESVGKATIARDVIARAVDAVPGSWMHEIRTLTSEAARQLPAIAGGRGRARKIFLIHLDGASAQACNQLLKLLEEPPRSAAFVLVASMLPLDTIMSRSVLVRFGLLSPAEVELVLQQGGMSAEAARRIAPLSGGMISGALAVGQDSADSRSRVSRALRAISAADIVRLDLALREWGDADTLLLSAWAAEASTGRWRQFDAGFAPLGTADARLILGGLSRYPRAAGRVAAASVLSPLALR